MTKTIFIFLLTLLIIFLIISFYYFNQVKKQEEVKREIKKVDQKNNINYPKNMEIKSPAFNHNEFIPQKYSCQGEDINPPLIISNVPENAQSLVLIVDDPDAPAKTWLHWLVYDIDPKIGEIKENSVPEGAKQGLNDFSKLNYGGPCPPSGTHRYFFKLYALDKKLNLDEGKSLTEVLQEMEGHIIDQAELIGLYKK